MRVIDDRFEPEAINDGEIPRNVSDVSALVPGLHMKASVGAEYSMQWGIAGAAIMGTLEKLNQEDDDCVLEDGERFCISMESGVKGTPPIALAILIRQAGGWEWVPNADLERMKGEDREAYIPVGMVNGPLPALVILRVSYAVSMSKRGRKDDTHCSLNVPAAGGEVDQDWAALQEATERKLLTGQEAWSLLEQEIRTGPGPTRALAGCAS